MNDEALDSLERQLTSYPSPKAPTDLRDVVLAKVHCQLTAAKWDRCLARTAAVLVMVGVVMNVGVGRLSNQRATESLANSRFSETVVAMGVTVADATDVDTGNYFARHLAALSGSRLTSEQATAINQRLLKRPAVLTFRKDG